MYKQMYKDKTLQCNRTEMHTLTTASKRQYCLCSGLCMCVASQTAYLGIIGGKSEDDTVE